MNSKSAILAVALGALLAGPALADDRDRDRDRDRRYGDRYENRDWRHVPPARYRGHRSYRQGYAAGYRDAARRCRHGGRHGRWWRNTHGDWYFSADDLRASWVNRYDPLAVVYDR